MNEISEKIIDQNILSGDNIEAIRKYIDDGGDVNKEFEGDFLICRAATNKNWEIVRLLLENGADINVRNKWAESVSSAISTIEDSDIVVEFLSKGADPNLKACYGTEVFTHVVGKGNPLIVKAFIDYGVDVNTPQSRKRRLDPPLLVAVNMGNGEVAKILLKSGINTKYVGDRWALSCAVRQSNYELIDILLTDGFNFRFRKNDFENSNSCAGKFDHPMIEAALLGDYRAAKLMLEAGVKPDFPSSGAHKKTALYHAATTGNKDLVKILIEHGAELNYDRSDKSITKYCVLPICGAIYKEQIEIIDIMLKSGADPLASFYGGKNDFNSITFAIAQKSESVINYFNTCFGEDYVDNQRELFRQG